ncbi:hypothetical protein ACFZAR_31495 [Streptomyces sp. NPDC008222]|uniref:hypothetical protein n=1 Tax=Streptomyces sp. NPDC008222 TaxID=3364820 RepID=UPI0036E9DB1E
MHVPADPRTPQQRVKDQLAACRRQLTKPWLSRSQRREIADRIHQLTQEAKSLGV